MQVYLPRQKDYLPTYNGQKSAQLMMNDDKPPIQYE